VADRCNYCGRIIALLCHPLKSEPKSMCFDCKGLVVRCEAEGVMVIFQETWGSAFGCPCGKRGAEGPTGDSSPCMDIWDERLYDS